MKIIYQLRESFPNFNLLTFIKEVEGNMDGCSSILDVGCGGNSPLRLLSGNYDMVGVDGFKEGISRSKAKGIHKKYFLLDVRKLPLKFKRKSFDCLVALDVIEHLKKEDGYKFLDDLESIAKKRVIIVTPNGFIEQDKETNILERHLSGWTVKDFKKLGYEVHGLYGHKYFQRLRTPEGGLKWKPRLFWGFIWGTIAELLHHLWTKRQPEHALELIAVKRIR